MGKHFMLPQRRMPVYIEVPWWFHPSKLLDLGKVQIVSFKPYKKGFRCSSASPHQTSLSRFATFGTKPFLFCKKPKQLHRMNVAMHLTRDKGNSNILQGGCVRA